MPTEADTCRKLVLPELYAAGVSEGRIVVAENRACRSVQDRADCRVDFLFVAPPVGQWGIDSFDLLCHLAFNAPFQIQRERTDNVNRCWIQILYSAFRTLQARASERRTEFVVIDSASDGRVSEQEVTCRLT